MEQKPLAIHVIDTIFIIRKISECKNEYEINRVIVSSYERIYGEKIYNSQKEDQKYLNNEKSFIG